MRTLLITAALLAVGTPAHACPFCQAESRTLSEELADCDYAVLAKLVRPAAAESLGLNDQPRDGEPFGTIDPETGAATFRAETVLLARPDAVGPAEGDPIEAIFFGDPDLESTYFLRGIGDPLEWTIPLKLSEVAVAYVKRLETLPTSGADRLAFFQDYLQHEDPLLSQDAYDEFARASYADVKGLKDRMDRRQLLAWIESPAISPSRRRLFLTMLGVCGAPEDIPKIERLLLSDSRRLTPAAESLAAFCQATGGPLSAALAPETVRLDQRRQKLGLDAMVACYLTLRGGDGLDVVDRRFLGDAGVDYSHAYHAMMAIRFLAEESDLVPRERLMRSARLLLDNRDFADQVIPDLARWKDWSVLDRLVAMYKASETGEYEKYIRVPIITYLDVAVEQEGDLADRANAALAEIEPIDPDAFRRARSTRLFGFLARAQPEPEPGDALADIADDEGAADGPSPDEPLEAALQADVPPPPALFSAQKPAVAPLTPEAPPTAEAPPTRDEAEDASLSNLPSGPAAEPSAAGGVASEGSGDGPQAAPPALASTAAGPTGPPTATAKPPAWWLLLGAPLIAFAALFGVFWTVLRAGGA